MSSNCLSSLLTSCTVVPDPAAMRFLRLALIMSGVLRSFLVIDEMIAAWRFRMRGVELGVLELRLQLAHAGQHAEDARTGCPSW